MCARWRAARCPLADSFLVQTRYSHTLRDELGGIQVQQACCVGRRVEVAADARLNESDLLAGKSRGAAVLHATQDHLKGLAVSEKLPALPAVCIEVQRELHLERYQHVGTSKRGHKDCFGIDIPHGKPDLTPILGLSFEEPSESGGRTGARLLTGGHRTLHNAREQRPGTRSGQWHRTAHHEFEPRCERGGSEQSHHELMIRDAPNSALEGGSAFALTRLVAAAIRENSDERVDQVSFRFDCAAESPDQFSKLFQGEPHRVLGRM